MKKVLLNLGSLASSASRSLPNFQWHSCASFHRPKFAPLSSKATDNSANNKSELIITELSAGNQIKRKDAVLRATNKTLLLNATVDWVSNAENDDLANEDLSNFSQKHKSPAKREIFFKFSTKKLFEEYPTAEKLWAAVESTGFSMKTFLEMIYENPEIITFSPDLVVSNVSQLMRLGFNAKEIMRIVRGYPYILEFKGYDVYDTYETWRAGGLFERFLIEFFTQEPTLFALPNDEIQFRLKRLSYLMRNKINRVTAALKRNPGIMDGDWQRVEKNFEFLYKTMRVTERDISRSKGLSLPLPFIKLRYDFLVRCGVYIRPSIKNKGGSFEEHKNPSLFAIVDTSDETFATNTAKVSLEEYLVFKKLMRYSETKALPVEDSLDEI